MQRRAWGLPLGADWTRIAPCSGLISDLGRCNVSCVSCVVRHLVHCVSLAHSLFCFDFSVWAYARSRVSEHECLHDTLLRLQSGQQAKACGYHAARSMGVPPRSSHACTCRHAVQQWSSSMIHVPAALHTHTRHPHNRCWLADWHEHALSRCVDDGESHIGREPRRRR